MISIKKYVLTTALVLISAVAFCQEEDVAFAVIEQVPIYPGCEMFSDNLNLKNCMSEKIVKHVSNNFETRLASRLDLHGKQRIAVQFKVDKNGEVTDVLARASHPALEREAKRVINLIPQMIPGTQKGEKVGVLYSLPILFAVETKLEEKARKKRERKEKRKKNN